VNNLKAGINSKTYMKTLLLTILTLPSSNMRFKFIADNI